MSPRSRRLCAGAPRDCAGQATVELIALLPLLVLVGLLLWQAVVLGHALWSAGAAAKAAARAAAIGADARAAAEGVLPPRLDHGLRVTTDDGGEVAVRVRLPAVVGGARLGTYTARTWMEPQR
ncbi:hypothetical protein [Conexibacter sp. SYSU D00693]|uniref:hypothetical protein n=1 Tax=Conexibacter sp. SYSU D00693 TaxID=2812560 RepID=UPI00196A7B34|nr:hypothetical protein [Conexibacter sp. SYSU D00693]